MRLVLASASPRRADLLRSAGFTFETMPVDVDERPHPGEAPTAYVRRLAGEKSARALDVLSRSNGGGAGARDVGHSARSGDDRQGPPKAGQSYAERAGLPDRTLAEDDIVVLGADTAVVLESVILGKPRDDEDASEMLRRLSGRKHEVLTGVSLRTGAGERGLVEVTSVWFACLTPEAIAWYVSTGEGRDKAGAYAIQGLASRMIPRIEGSYTNVVGLPVAAVAGLLEVGNRPCPG
jgi:septum formation protein